MKISVISPCYRAEMILPNLVREIEKTVQEITDDFEILLVEDCGPDNSQQVIRELCANDSHVKGIFLSRNFGQQYAIDCGLHHATGDFIVTLDCDLQDNPIYIKDLYQKLQEGYDIVYASRQNRQDDILKKLGSKGFNMLMSSLTGTKQDDTVANFVMYTKTAVDAMLSMHDYNRYYPLINRWVGFRQYTLPIQHSPRADEKKSSYTMMKRVKLAFNTAIAFSDKPLRSIISLGLVFVSLSVLFAIFFVVRYFLSSQTVSGWTTMFISLWFLGGIIIMLLGIIGIYIGKLFEETKGRPSYIIREKIGF